MRKPERPIREDRGSTIGDRYTETHPAYAMIGASRVTHSPPGISLAGSDFLHQHYMTIKIHRAERDRGLSNDWWHAGQEVIEVELSEAQWATFVSTPNMGNGVPCTVAWDISRDDPQVPGIIPIDSRRMEFTDEVREHLDDSLKQIELLKAEIETTNLSQKAKKRLTDMADRAYRQMGGNLDFVAHEFDEHAEKTIEHAKIEIEAWLTSAVQRAGLQALGGNVAPPISLPEGDPET